jgi:hypothetical protein
VRTGVGPAQRRRPKHDACGGLPSDLQRLIDRDIGQNKCVSGDMNQESIAFSSHH